MKIPAGHLVGAASHTGSVRSDNEDDYLVGALVAPGPELLLCAIADGMGGVAGGAAASRAALRGLAATVLDAGAGDPPGARLVRGFTAAAARVREQAMATPALADMGTTLTALCLTADGGEVGHVGDTRLYRLRGGALVALTTDHAVREPDNLLTRCIGGGQENAVPDALRFLVEPGDRYLLLSDGVWSVVRPGQVQELAGQGPPQAVAEALVAAALAAGGPDNATAVVVEVVRPTGDGAPVEVALPREERPVQGLQWPAPVSLRPPRWPWLLFVVAAVFAALIALRLGYGIDGWVWLRSRF